MFSTITPIHSRTSFGMNAQTNKLNIGSLLKGLNDNSLNTRNFIMPDLNFSTVTRQINNAGTLDTHPHFVSSNGTALPTTKEEIMALYRKHVPEKYQKFLRLGIFDNNDLATVDGKLAGRYAPQDENTEINMKKALTQGMVDPKKHVIIADLGGPHSIAAARELGNAGYVIIPHFNHKKLDFADQDTGALSYFAKEISEINERTLEKNPDAPWALIIDTHQNDLSFDEIAKGIKADKILKDNDIPLVPEGYEVIRLTEFTNPVSSTRCEYIVNLFKNRGTQVFDLGLDTYKRGALLGYF